MGRSGPNHLGYGYAGYGAQICGALGGSLIFRSEELAGSIRFISHYDETSQDLQRQPRRLLSIDTTKRRIKPNKENLRR